MQLFEGSVHMCTIRPRIKTRKRIKKKKKNYIVFKVHLFISSCFHVNTHLLAPCSLFELQEISLKVR